MKKITGFLFSLLQESLDIIQPSTSKISTSVCLSCKSAKIQIPRSSEQILNLQVYSNSDSVGLWWVLEPCFISQGSSGIHMLRQIWEPLTQSSILLFYCSFITIALNHINMELQVFVLFCFLSRRKFASLIFISHLDFQSVLPSLISCDSHKRPRKSVKLASSLSVDGVDSKAPSCWKWHSSL